MHAQDVYRAPAVVTLPGELDLTSREHAYDRLYAALASGAPVVIADLTATTFCDCASLRHLVTVQNRAAAQDAQLRVVIAPGSAVHRLADLIGLDRRILRYPSLREAIRPHAPARHSPETIRTTAKPKTSRPGMRHPHFDRAAPARLRARLRA